MTKLYSRNSEKSRSRPSVSNPARLWFCSRESLTPPPCEASGLLDGDGEVGADLAPQVRFVGRAVVGEHTLDGDAAVGEPGHGPGEDADGGGCLLVVVALGVGDAGVVVDDSVDEAGPDLGVVVAGLDAGAVPGRDAVAVTLGDADEPPAATIGDVAEFGDIDVDQFTRSGPLVAASGLPG